MAGTHDTCAACKYYRGELIGQCRRYPQHVAKHNSEWCGEFLSLSTDAPKRRGRPPKEAA